MDKLLSGCALVETYERTRLAVGIVVERSSSEIGVVLILPGELDDVA